MVQSHHAKLNFRRIGWSITSLRNQSQPPRRGNTKFPRRSWDTEKTTLDKKGGICEVLIFERREEKKTFVSSQQLKSCGRSVWRLSSCGSQRTMQLS